TGNACLFVPRGATRRRARSGRAGQAPNTVASALPPEGFERRGGEMGQRARIHLSGLTGTQAQAHVGGAQEGATPHTTAGSMAHVKSRRRSEEHTSELQSRENLVCRLLLAK